jgi:hypothetical protein
VPGLLRLFEQVVEPTTTAFVVVRPFDLIARKQADGLSRVPHAFEDARGALDVAFSLSLGPVRHFASNKCCTLQVN